MLKIYYNSIKLVWKSVEAWFFVTTTLLIFLSLEPIISISLVNNLVNSVQKNVNCWKQRDKLDYRNFNDPGYTFNYY